MSLGGDSVITCGSCKFYLDYGPKVGRICRLGYSWGMLDCLGVKRPNED